MKKAAILVSFFLGTPLLIVALSIYLAFISFHKSTSVLGASTQTVAYAALPSTDAQIVPTVEVKEAREEIVRSFFEKYHSPLLPLANDVVRLADQYGIDFRLVPAIGMQESNNCIHPPSGTNNCWGYGIYSGSRTSFSSYLEGLEAVTKGLAGYKASGLITPEQIMTRYTPGSNGSWASAVNQFMNEMH